MRCYDEKVQVRLEPGAVAGSGSPNQFLWRGRLYLVREVLAHWRERTAWWDGADPERQVWRVEASSGRSAGAGVFELEVGHDGPDPQPSWRLTRVCD